MENVVFFFHILGVMLFVAGILVAGTAFEVARRRQRPSEIALLLGLTRVGVVLVAIGTVLAGVFGLWLVHLGNWGYGTGVGGRVDRLVPGGDRVRWVGGRRPKQARLLASRLAEKDTGSDGVTRPGDHALMVFKP